jgi:hypothetical protein
MCPLGRPSKIWGRFLTMNQGDDLAAEILASPAVLDRGLHHAQEVLRARWPEWEQIALVKAAADGSALRSCVRYAEQVVKGLWPELEPLLLKAAGTDVEYNDSAADYAFWVIRGPWEALEHEILNGRCNPCVAVIYAYEIKKSRWDALERLLLTTVPTRESCVALYMYAQGLFQGRWPAAEEYLLSPAAHAVAAHAAYYYAWLILNERWEEAEHLLAWSPSDMLAYADDVVHGRLPPHLHQKMLLQRYERPNDEHITQYFEKYGDDCESLWAPPR